MQIEKHINITQVPNGAIVSFGGQVCLTVSKLFENAYAWRASPVFAKLTYGANSFSEVPSSYEMYETMADAVAGGLVALDEMNAFYGVVDIPEDSTLDESAEEFDVENELQSLSESFVVRKITATRSNPERTMVSAFAVIQRARELAKEAGVKQSQDFMKAAHADIISRMKAESVEELEEGSVSKDKQKTPYRNINSPEYKAAAERQKALMVKDSASRPGKELLSKMKAEEFVQYEDAVADALAYIKEDCRAEAMENSDSLIEAHQLSQELFEDIVEEYLNELSNVTLASYKKKAGEYASAADKAANVSFKAGDTALGQRWQNRANKKFGGIIKATNKQFDNDAKNEEVEELDEHFVKGDKVRFTPPDIENSKPFNYDEWKASGVKSRNPRGHKEAAAIGDAQRRLDAARKLKTNEEVEELVEARLAQPLKGHAYHKKSEAELNYIIKDAGQAAHANKGGSAEGKYLDQMNDAATVLYYRKKGGKQVHEKLDEAALSGEAYWKAKEAESKEEYLKAQRKALGIAEPVKRGRGKPTLIDRDSLRTRAHSNIEAGKRPTAGFDRNEKIHFVRHLKNHPDFADHHVSHAGRPTGTTNAAKEQKDLTKKKQDTAFSMWAGLGKR